MLDGLGAPDGPPVVYNWTARGLLPELLPWLVILALLALKPNHGWSAWWIWLPLACLEAGWHWLQLGLESSSSGQVNGVLNVFMDVPCALAFGVAALWLLAPYVDRRRRFGCFLSRLLVLAAFGAFSFAVASGWDEGAAGRIAALPGPGLAVGAAWAEAGLQVVVLVLLALVMTAAMVLSGFACRGRYLPFRLCVWLFLSLLGVWVAVLALLHPLLPASNSNVQFAALGIGAFMLAVTFVTLLPFVILSLISPFFRERLKPLMQVSPNSLPPGPRQAVGLNQ